MVEPLLAHPALKAVTFTGSTATGRGLRRALATHNVRLQTEMGGKNAVVVLPDADLDRAAETIAASAFAQAGQRCTAASRVIAVGSVFDDLKERLVSIARQVRVGSAADPDATMGPLISQGHLDSVTDLVARSRTDGDEFLAGGQRSTRAGLDHGFFFEPTVVDVASVEGTLWVEEVFGPVLALTRADDLDAAIANVNASEYGLSAAIFTRDLSAATRFAERAETGQVAVNRPTSGWDVHQPFGGFKDSGSPFKEQGEGAMQFFTRTKTVAMGT